MRRIGDPASSLTSAEPGTAGFAFCPLLGENLRFLFRSARAAQSVMGKPLTCVNASRSHLRQENNIRS
jgi:hypothetical protein